MAYLRFNKAELVNLEYSLKREVLSTNSGGGYLNTTIVGCNTRKYHGLLAVPIYRFGGHRYMLLSAVDETLFQHNKPFNLGIHCYGDIYEPRGHKYIVDFQMDPVPTVTYSVGGMVFRKEMILGAKGEQLLIRYTLLESQGEAVLRLKPFLAFRSIHELTHANTDANTRYREIKGGASFCLYDGFPDLNLQLSKEAEYVHCPDWYNNVVYGEEARRGFECAEDLMVPGFFELTLKKGESVILSASTGEINPASLKAQFTRLENAAAPRNDYDACLKAAASGMFAENENGNTCVCTGFSWHEIGGLRETCIALPGLTIYNNGDVKLFEKVLDGLLSDKHTDIFEGCNQSESPLRIIELVQHLISFTGQEAKVWKKYGKVVREIVKSYFGGRPESVCHDNGYIWSYKAGVALSWMNAYVEGRPVTERCGYQVETNCFWYNALSFVAQMEPASAFGKMCAATKKKIEETFMDMFWVEERHHLADFVNSEGKNVFTRPNQLYACSLPNSPVSEEVRSMILKAVSRELVTSRGIRTLSPKNPIYRSHYEGNQAQRDTATHNGCNRPWLLGSYIDASFRLYGGSFIRNAQDLIDGFQEDMNVHGIGCVAEIYDGDPQYAAHGAICSALSVGEILRVKHLINKYKEAEQ